MNRSEHIAASLRLTKAERMAYVDGAQFKRGGQTLARTISTFNTQPERWMAALGFSHQSSHPDVRVDYAFYLTHDQCKVCSANNGTKRSETMRTAEELEALREEYRTGTYDPYAADETAAGRTPQDFDEAFAAHLEALDAEGTSEGSTATVGDVAAPAAPKAKGKGKAKAGTKTAAKPKAPAAPKEPKPKSFRPTSDDRKTVNAAAAQALKAAKVEGTPRLKVGGDPYVEFLQGRALKLDANGNGSVTLDVVTAAKTDEVVGKVVVTVKKGVMTAKGSKA